MNESYFCLSVITSGWFLGWLLAKRMQQGQGITPSALLISFAAVAAPAAFGWTFAGEPLRHLVLSQFLKAGPVKYFGLAILIPALIAATGFLTARQSVNFEDLRKVLLKLSGMIPLLLIWAGLEEIGWRGFFVTSLAGGLNPIVAVLSVGLIWGLWHAPQMFFNLALQEKLKGRLYQGAFLWVCQCISLGAILGWWQIRSGSFYAPLIAHACINYFGNLTDALLVNEHDPILTSNFGWPANLASVAIAAVLWGLF